MLNEDYKDMLRALSDEKVRFLLVGAYAMAAHGYPRATMDIDIWVMPSPQNADAILRALLRFGAPLHNLTKEDFQRDGPSFRSELPRGESTSSLQRLDSDLRKHIKGHCQ